MFIICTILKFKDSMLNIFKKELEQNKEMQQKVCIYIYILIYASHICIRLWLFVS